MGKGRDGNQKDASESVDSFMNIAYTIHRDPLWSNLVDEVWETPHHRVEHQILGSYDEASGDGPHDVSNRFTYVGPPEASGKFSSSPKYHVTFQDKVIDHAQRCYDKKDNPNQGLV